MFILLCARSKEVDVSVCKKERMGILGEGSYYPLSIVSFSGGREQMGFRVLVFDAVGEATLFLVSDLCRQSATNTTSTSAGVSAEHCSHTSEY